MRTPTRSLALALALAFSPAALAADPEAILHQMSNTLASSKHFTFDATRELDAALREGHDLPEKARVHVAVSRPNQLAGRAVSKEGTRRFIADGRKVTLVDEKKGYYAQVPMQTSIDGVVDKVDQIYGFTPPLAEFAVSDVYRELRHQARSVSYLGTGSVGGFLGLGGVECHRIALKGGAADAELWVATGDHLPRQLVATFKRPGQPQLHVTFSAWNLAAPVTAADFTFTPPPGSQRVEMWSRERMQKARKH